MNDAVYWLDPGSSTQSTRLVEAMGVDARRPSCLAADGRAGVPAWCGTEDGGVFRSDDGGRSWTAAGLTNEHITALALDPVRDDVAWAGTEPSALWRTEDGGATWERREGLLKLPSSSEWAFPPRPETHHVRWIACHPNDHGRLWLAIEAGALISTPDGGRTWEDRVPDGPYDTHELAIHPEAPDYCRVSAGDGYFESRDRGRSWSSPMEGLDVGYLRSVAVEPDDPAVVVVSASSGPRSAYVAGRSDGRLYRREGTGRWARITSGWPDPPETIAPLLLADPVGGGFLAADERGIHRSRDSGRSWDPIAGYPRRPDWLRGLAITGG